MVLTGPEFLRRCRELDPLPVLGVLGSPVSHSRSPELHALIYSYLNLEARYFAVHIPEKEELISFLSQTATLKNCRGFNVTIPWKETALLLSDPDPFSEKAGAVNTLINRNGRFMGTNTDWQGFLYPIREKSITTILILGWGGAAKGIAAGLAHHWPDCRITVVSRRADFTLPGVNWIRSDYSAFPETAPVDLIINTTPLGMTGKSENFPGEFLDQLPDSRFAYDVIYTPQETAFLARMKQKGSEQINGLQMFVVQAVQAHETWFGPVDPDQKEPLIRFLTQKLSSR